GPTRRMGGPCAAATTRGTTKAPRPRHGHATGRDLPSAPAWSAGANDRLTNAVAWARFDASQFALPQILAEPDQVQAWRHASFSAHTPVNGYKAGSRMMGRLRTPGDTYE